MLFYKSSVSLLSKQHLHYPLHLLKSHFFQQKNKAFFNNINEDFLLKIEEQSYHYRHRCHHHRLLQLLQLSFSGVMLQLFVLPSFPTKL